MMPGQEEGGDGVAHGNTWHREDSISAYVLKELAADHDRRYAIVVDVFDEQLFDHAG